MEYIGSDFHCDVCPLRGSFFRGSRVITPDFLLDNDVYRLLKELVCINQQNEFRKIEPMVSKCH